MRWGLALGLCLCLATLGEAKRLPTSMLFRFRRGPSDFNRNLLLRHALIDERKVIARLEGRALEDEGTEAFYDDEFEKRGRGVDFSRMLFRGKKQPNRNLLLRGKKSIPRQSLFG